MRFWGVCMKLFAEIVKVDPEKRMVYGYASTGALDSQGERVSVDALKVALPDYMKFANIREMHQPSAVGVAKQAEIDNKGLYIGAKVVDDVAWKKVTEEVYKGFSIGGRAVEKVDDTITSLRLTEISLVDRPANPECVFDVYKADDIPQGEEAEKTETQAPDIKKYLGEEVYDAQTALEALSAVFYLFSKEQAEQAEGHPEAAEQLAALQLVIDKLKAFIASEIQETEPDAGGGDMLMADQGGDIEKAGARNSKTDLGKIQGIHDHAVALGADCGSRSSKAEGGGMDIEERLAKIEAGAEALQKVNDELKAENQELKDRLEKIEAMPAPTKGMLKVVEKSEDTGGAPVELEPKPILKADGSVDQEATALELIKFSQRKPVLVKIQ